MARQKKHSKKITNKNGVSFTENEQKKLISLVNSVNRKRKRILTDERLIDVRTALGVDEGFIFGVHSEKNLWGSGADTLLTKNRSKSFQRFNSKDEYRSYMKELKRLAKKDYVESRMKHYQKNQLKAMKSVYGKDSSSIIRGLKQLTPKEYLKVRAKFDLPSISYVYSDEEYDSKLEQLKSSYELINNEFNLDERVYQQKVKRQQRRKGK